jgi:chloride channel protein, CIC family
MSRSPLPARILIPVANPLTAEELIRLGSAILDKRSGELTALGIVEVPEGMPLSEGATRARHARRLLQRVLDFAPEGTTIHPIVRIGRRAAEGIIEASGEQESDLVIFGWGGKTPSARNGHGPAVFSPTIDEVVRDSPCDIAVVKQRGATKIGRILVPARTRSWRSASPTPSRARTTRQWRCSTSSRPASPQRSEPRPSMR